MLGPFVLLRHFFPVPVPVPATSAVSVPVPATSAVSVIRANGGCVISSLSALLAWCTCTAAWVGAAVAGCLSHPVGVVGAIFTVALAVLCVVAVQRFPRCTLAVVAPTVIASPGRYRRMHRATVVTFTNRRMHRVTVWSFADRRRCAVVSFTHRWRSAVVTNAYRW